MGDKLCVAGDLGCWADGVHAQCRFCGHNPSIGVPCPEGAAQPNSPGCAFDNEPSFPCLTVYSSPSCWDCRAGLKGCFMVVTSAASFCYYFVLRVWLSQGGAMLPSQDKPRVDWGSLGNVGI